ncbi:MAG TPA: YqaA family protein [Gammaproteobacteria bacterium]|nr:YqaA family protein [Gammaproteobacteria bacterium]
MRLFSALYTRVLAWSAHPHAKWYLGGLSFAESSFFPIPPDVMLAPMTLARPDQGLRYALITTVMSVLGGIAGYLIGMFALELIEPLLLEFGYWDGYLRARAWFEDWGFWAIFVAGFSPIPYKVFTIAAGALRMNLPLFILASALGRGARFFLVAGLVMWGGPRVEAHLRRHIDVIGWAVVVLLVAAYFFITL